MRTTCCFLFCTLFLPACGKPPKTSCCISCDLTYPAHQAAFKRGVDYLLAQQSKDGAWRSEVYGHFRGGDALTPLVVMALLPARNDPDCAGAIGRGLTFMSIYVLPDGTIDPQKNLAYPVYTTSLMVKALALDLAHDDNSQEHKAWTKLLRDWQMTEENGWQPDDWQYGGWGYCGVRPRKPADGPIPEALEANLSATVHALEGLRTAGVPANDQICAKAMAFVKRCQNFKDKDPDPAIDDGGFTFTPGDPFRNKAGPAGQIGNRVRFRSYGSATADGLRCLRLCDLLAEPARARQAMEYLDANLAINEPFKHHGRFASEREKDRDAALFYYTATVNEALRFDGNCDARKRWLRDELVRRQRDDGSWRNDLDAVRENDPIVATALALLALR
jgi:squalene-hopene/tetraprenyl-beta-curcumene cyclase